MRLFARFTAIIFLILGVCAILAGLFVATSGFATPAKTISSVPSLIPDFSGLYILAKIIAGSAIAMQGLFLAAIGQVIWLLANVSEQTKKTSLYLRALIERQNRRQE